MASTERAFGDNTWKVWLLTIGAAVIGNLLLRAGTLAVFDIPVEFVQLSTAVPTIFLTVVGVGAGLGVAHMVGWSAAQPVRLFRQIAIAALVVSFLPDLWMLTDAGADAFPGTTIPGVATLMLQHVLAASVILWMLTVRGQPS